MKVLQFIVKDDGIFPNSPLPVLLYKQALDLPFIFKARNVKKLFIKNGWSNNWRAGIFTYHHYHSNTHEVLGVIKGATTVILGGDSGQKLKIEKGDVLIIPAGVAHKNLGKEKDIICIGGYPGGKEYDINYGKEGERPTSDRNIDKVTIPRKDPVTGEKDPINKIWNNNH